MSLCKTSSACFRSAALDVDCGETSVVAMKRVMAWPGVAWWRCPVRAIASSFAVGSRWFLPLYNHMLGNSSIYFPRVIASIYFLPRRYSLSSLLPSMKSSHCYSDRRVVAAGMSFMHGRSTAPISSPTSHPRLGVLVYAHEYVSTMPLIKPRTTMLVDTEGLIDRTWK